MEAKSLSVRDGALLNGAVNVGAAPPTSRPARGVATRVILRELAQRLGCTLRGDGAVEVHRVAGIEDSGPGDLTFVANRKYAACLATTRASAVILSPDRRDAAAQPPLPQPVPGLRPRGRRCCTRSRGRGRASIPPRRSIPPRASAPTCTWARWP